MEVVASDVAVAPADAVILRDNVVLVAEEPLEVEEDDALLCLVVVVIRIFEVELSVAASDEFVLPVDVVGNLTCAANLLSS